MFDQWLREMRGSSDLLDILIEEGIRQSIQAGYPTPIFYMRTLMNLGTVPGISRLVLSGTIQSGFRKLCEMGLSDWTCEKAVLHFPDRFSSQVVSVAKFRLDNVNDPALR
jgi:hypothetical protein